MAELKIKEITVATKKAALKGGSVLRTSAEGENDQRTRNLSDTQRYAIGQLSIQSKKVAEKGIQAVTFSARSTVRRRKKTVSCSTTTDAYHYEEMHEAGFSVQSEENPVLHKEIERRDRIGKPTVTIRKSGTSKVPRRKRSDGAWILYRGKRNEKHSAIRTSPIYRGVSKEERKAYRKKVQWEVIHRSHRRIQVLSLGSIGIVLLAFIIILMLSITAGAYGIDVNDDGLAGEGSTAMVLIASSQIGNEGGELYWRWYGFTFHVDWCAVFVSWCADQAGLLEDGNMPKFAVCDDGVAWFINRQRWITGADRYFRPPAGSIIFFDWDQDGRSDHVGIVEKSEEGLVCTIEGNSRDVCRWRCYSLDSGVIIGYGILEKP